MSSVSTRFHFVVVEDSPSDIHLLGLALDEAGVSYDLTLFEDGAAALSYFTDNSCRIPDAAILDLNVPKAEGTEILDVIRRTPRLSAVAVVVLSSSEAPQDIERVKQLGADCHLVKPLDLDEFMKLGRSIVECVGTKRATNPAT